MDRPFSQCAATHLKTNVELNFHSATATHLKTNVEFNNTAMTDQSPSDDFGIGHKNFPPLFGEQTNDFDIAYNGFMHQDTSLPTTEPVTLGQEYVSHPEILDLNQLAHNTMENTQVANEVPATTIPELDTRQLLVVCDSEPSSTTNHGDHTAEHLSYHLYLPPTSLNSAIDTPLTTSQLIAEINAVAGVQPIATQSQLEIEAPVVRSQLFDSSSISPYSHDFNTANSPTNPRLPHMTPHCVNSPSPSPDSVTPPVDTHEQEYWTRSLGSMWMLQTPLPPLPPQYPPHQQTEYQLELIHLSFIQYLSKAVEWLDNHNPPALYAHYEFVKKHIPPYSQPKRQSAAAPSGTTYPTVLGKRVRRDSGSGEDTGSSTMASLANPQSEEAKPIKRHKTSTRPTMKKATGSGQASTAPNGPTKHRNSFILYRCLLSNIRKWVQEQAPGVGSSTGPPKKQPVDHQCDISRRAGVVYKTPCWGVDEGLLCGHCANCLMRRLFERAAAQLKDDVTLLEMQLRKTPNPSQAEFMPNRQRIDQAINWTVFAQIYYQSDLFSRHPELWVEGRMPTVENIRVIWMENEIEKQKQKFDAVKKEFQ